MGILTSNLKALYVLLGRIQYKTKKPTRNLIEKNAESGLR